MIKRSQNENYNVVEQAIEFACSKYPEFCDEIRSIEFTWNNSYGTSYFQPAANKISLSRWLDDETLYEHCLHEIAHAIAKCITGKFTEKYHYHSGPVFQEVVKNLLGESYIPGYGTTIKPKKEYEVECYWCGNVWTVKGYKRPTKILDCPVCKHRTGYAGFNDDLYKFIESLRATIDILEENYEYESLYWNQTSENPSRKPIGGFIDLRLYEDQDCYELVDELEEDYLIRSLWQYLSIRCYESDMTVTLHIR